MSSVDFKCLSTHKAGQTGEQRKAVNIFSKSLMRCFFFFLIKIMLSQIHHLLILKNFHEWLEKKKQTCKHEKTAVSVSLESCPPRS